MQTYSGESSFQMLFQDVSIANIKFWQNCIYRLFKDSFSVANSRLRHFKHIFPWESNSISVKKMNMLNGVPNVSTCPTCQNV